MPNQQYQSSYTRELADGESLTINGVDNISQFSIVAKTGVCTLTGSRKFQGASSSALTITAGIPFTKVADNYSFLDGYTITASGGTTLVDLS